MNYECNKSNLENSKWIKRLLFSHRPQRAKYERVQPQDMNITADATKEMRETWRRHATIKKEGNDRRPTMCKQKQFTEIGGFSGRKISCD